jgi:predicted nuclease of predicted toxin-antitoxin system
VAIKLYLDADITAAPLLASTLRQRGFDVVSAVEAGNAALSDRQQFEYAIRHQRVLLTFNIKDFVPLAETFYVEHREFPGLIVSPQIKGTQFSLLLRLILNLLHRVDAETMHNTVRFLQAFQ